MTKFNRPFHNTVLASAFFLFAILSQTILAVDTATKTGTQEQIKQLDATKSSFVPARSFNCSAEGTEINVAATEVSKIGDSGLQIQKLDKNGYLTINSVPVKIVPGKKWKVVVYVKPKAVEESSLELMVREHAGIGRPFKPYHTFPKQFAGLSISANDEWVTRQVYFPVREDANYLTFSLVLRGGKTDLILGGAEVIPEEQEEKAVAELLQKCREKAATRKRLTDHTLVMPRSQLKYGFDRNYLHWWIDRPLFCDRSFRTDDGNVYLIKKKTLQKEMDIADLYGTDGLASLVAGHGQLGNYLQATDILKELDNRDFVLYPEYYGAGDATDSYFERYATALERALKSPNSYRINGKVVISSYIGDGWTPSQLHEFLTKMRERCGDTFLFVVDRRRGTPVIQVQNGLLTVEDIQQELSRLREYLDVADGLMYMGANHVREYYKDTDYGESINVDYLANYLTPLFKSVLAEEPYKSKILGLSACVSYINHRSGSCKRQDRTRTLRRTFAAAAAAEPDFIGMPEWNEFNENTNAEPTVYRSLSSQRIIRYYTSQMRGLAPTPNPGDNLEIPNLILSYRRVLKIGEPLYIELLNVPDSNKQDTYTVRLQLLDLNGKPVRQFEEVEFSVDTLREQTFTVATEELAGHPYVVPALEIVNTEGKNFKFNRHFLNIRLQGTWNWIYTCVNQPLRDVLSPQEAEFEVQATEDAGSSALVFSGSLSCDEPIASVEVLENGVEVYAIDKANEFRRDTHTLFKAGFISQRLVPVKGYFRLHNAEGVQARPVLTHNFGTTDHKDTGELIVQDDRILLDTIATKAYREFYFWLPKNNVPDIVLEMDIEQGQFSVPLSTVMKTGMYSKTLPKQFFVRIEEFNKLPDLPPHLDAKTANFTFTAEPQSAVPVYHVRVITKSGKIWRSYPVAPIHKAGAEKLPVSVFSDVKGEVVEVQLPVQQIPDLQYFFSPESGDLLLNLEAERWTAELGGGISYGEPFDRGSQYPGHAKESNPTWKLEDDNHVLDFDGIGQYVNLPRESLPRGAFTLQMEIKVADPERDQVLFRSHGIATGCFMLKINNGMLSAAYVDHKNQTTVLESGLSVPPGEWLDVSVVYDLAKMQFRINEKKSEPLPLFAIPGYYQPAAFGGHTKPGFGVSTQDGFFKGSLRKLRILHRPLSM